MTEKIEYPDFKLISKLGKNKIKSKFPKYGNTWKCIQTNWEFWEERLKDEIKEIFESKNSEEREKEIIDAINILGFMFENNHLDVCLEEGVRRNWRYG